MRSKKTIYVNTRVRLQRLSDAKFFSGWVRKFTHEEVVVRMNKPLPMAVGDVFMVQVHGFAASALFQAVLLREAEGDFQFAIPESARIVAPNEQARVVTAGVTAMVMSGRRNVEADVVDVGARGVGLVTTCDFVKGERVFATFKTPVGPIESMGTVSYARLEAPEGTTYRIGIELDELDRIGNARWQRLLVFQDRRKGDRRATPRVPREAA